MGAAPALRTIIYRMLSAEPLERLAPAIVAIDLRMADIQCVGFFQDLLQGALLITSSYRCGYCTSGISTINPSESGVRLTWPASRERSTERRVRKECVSPWRFRWSPAQTKTHN